MDEEQPRKFRVFVQFENDETLRTFQGWCSWVEQNMVQHSGVEDIRFTFKDFRSDVPSVEKPL